MKRALEKGADPDLRLTWEDDTLAADAVLSGWPEAAELLLAAGANPEHEDICGQPPPATGGFGTYAAAAGSLLRKSPALTGEVAG